MHARKKKTFRWQDNELDGLNAPESAKHLLQLEHVEEKKQIKPLHTLDLS